MEPACDRRKYFSRKDAKTQSATAFPGFSLRVFAPLRLCARVLLLRYAKPERTNVLAFISSSLYHLPHPEDLPKFLRPGWFTLEYLVRLVHPGFEFYGMRIFVE